MAESDFYTYTRPSRFERGGYTISIRNDGFSLSRTFLGRNKLENFRGVKIGVNEVDNKIRFEFSKKKGDGLLSVTKDRMINVSDLAKRLVVTDRNKVQEPVKVKNNTFEINVQFKKKKK